jgi:hypothetical protein
MSPPDIFPGGTTDGNPTSKGTAGNEANALIPAGAKFYWKMLPPKKGSAAGGDVGKMAGFGPAPRLSPVSESVDASTGEWMNMTSGPSTHINIRDVHHWTESPTTSRREVPMLQLKELRILTNPMLNQILNNIGIAVQTGAGMIDAAAEAGKAIMKLSVPEDGEGKISAFIGGLADFAKDKLGSLETLGATALSEETASNFANPLNPYMQLYTTSPTKFKYTFPYMEDAYMNRSGGFGGGDQGGLLSNMSSIAANTLTDISLKKISAPGRMIEEPKGFTFTGREKAYTVKFPLFNTKDFTEIIRNWQFIYLLTYQNTPNRITRDLIDPPCIYEAKIPGVWYSKYSSITNMQVDFIGGRREMEMPVPYLTRSDDGSVDGKSETNWIQQKRKITTVIPDGYMVSITVTELFSETQNFMYHMIKESMSDKIRVNDTTDPF